MVMDKSACKNLELKYQPMLQNNKDNLLILSFIPLILIKVVDLQKNKSTRQRKCLLLIKVLMKQLMQVQKTEMKLIQKTEMKNLNKLVAKNEKLMFSIDKYLLFKSNII